MIKFILLYCCDRGLYVLGCFDEKKDAQALMKQDFLKVLKDENIEIDACTKTNINFFDFLSDDMEIDENYAWLNSKSTNYDWRIEEVKV